MFERHQGGDRAVLVQLDFGTGNPAADLIELNELARSAGAQIAGVVTGRRQRPDAALFAGSGKVEEIAVLCRDTGAELVIFNHPLSGAQERNLERALECRVIDRSLAEKFDLFVVEVEAAWVERRYRVTWEGAERFLGPGSPRDASDPGARPGAGAAAPDDPLFVSGAQWGLENSGTGPFGGVAGADIRARAGWAVTPGSTTLTIGIVDTGCDLGQPEIGGLLADGTSRIIRAFNSSIEGPEGSPADSVGHGTMVAARGNPETG